MRQNNPSSPHVSLMLGETGDLGLTYETGCFSSDPIGVIFRPESRQISVILSSGETILLKDNVDDIFLKPLAEARRILLMEMHQGHIMTGYGVPLLKRMQSLPEQKKTAVA